MARPGEQHFGISNHIKDRNWNQARNWWIEIEKTRLKDGCEAQETEQKLKQWLKKEIGVVHKKTENWYTSQMEVHSIAELKEKSGIETSFFKHEEGGEILIAPPLSQALNWLN